MSSPTFDLDLGFTVGADMPFEPAVEFAASEGFSFVELLLDGQYARERLEARRDSVREPLVAHGLGLVVHLPFSIAIGSPFTPVREAVVEEFVGGMDLAADLGADRIVFHPSSDAWELCWDESDEKGFVHEGLDALVPAARERGLVPCIENLIDGPYPLSGFPDLLSRYPGARMTFDTSHALLSGVGEAGMASFLEEYRERVGHLHLVDTRGGGDEHLPVGMGRLDFETVFRGLDGWSGTATLEVGTNDFDTIALGKRHVEALVE
jgi:sugar phosphate isomerase/epimerase